MDATFSFQDSDPANDSWYNFHDGTCSPASIPPYSAAGRLHAVCAPVGSQANSGCTFTSGYASPDVSSTFSSDSDYQPGSSGGITTTAAPQHGRSSDLRRQSSTSIVDVRLNCTLHLTNGDQLQGSPLSQYTIHCSPEFTIRQLPREASDMARVKHTSSEMAPEDCIAPDALSHVLSPVHQEILQAFMPQLTQYMSPRPLLPYLQRLDLVGSEDTDYISNPLRTDLERRHRILKTAPYRDPEAFERFVQCLSEEPEHSGHKYLARRLREAIEKKRQNPNAILRHTSSSEAPEGTSPERQGPVSHPCARSYSTRSLSCSEGPRRPRNDPTYTATANSKGSHQRKKSVDSQLDRAVVPSSPPQPSQRKSADSQLDKGMVSNSPPRPSQRKSVDSQLDKGMVSNSPPRPSQRKSVDSQLDKGVVSNSPPRPSQRKSADSQLDKGVVSNSPPRPSQRKSVDSQLDGAVTVVSDSPPRPNHSAPPDSSRTFHQQIRDQVGSFAHLPISPPYGIFPSPGAPATELAHSLPASPILSRHRPHPPECSDGYRSLRRVPRSQQGRTTPTADEKLNKKKLEWLQERVQFLESSEVVVFDSHTHCGSERRLLYSGVLQEHGKPRFVILLTDMLLILKSQRHRKSHLDWFSDQEFTAKKPMLLHLLTLQKQSKKHNVRMYFNNHSEAMEICLQAFSEEAKAVWMEQLSEAIAVSTAAHAETVLSIGSKVSKKNSGKPYTKVTVTELTMVDLRLPDHCLRGQLFCVVGVGRQRCRTPGVSGRGLLEWTVRCEFSDFSRTDLLTIHLHRESTFRPDDLLGCVAIPLPTLTQDQPGPHVMKGRSPLLNREQAIVGMIALHAEIGWETKM